MAKIKECEFYDFTSVILCSLQTLNWTKNILPKLPFIFGFVGYWHESESFNKYMRVICGFDPFHEDDTILEMAIYLSTWLDAYLNFKAILRMFSEIVQLAEDAHWRMRKWYPSICVTANAIVGSTIIFFIEIPVLQKSSTLW